MSPPRAASPLLRVKHALPPVRGTLLARARLEQRLDLDARLTLVAAPAGWGKTSLVIRWASVRALEHPVAWVSLDDGDDEPIRFWRYVLAALREVTDSIGPGAEEALVAGGDGPTSLALPMLLNELAALDAPLVLVLDDYHVITQPEVHESLEFVIVHLPEQVRVVLVTRTDPPLPLARMRVTGELAEVRAADLRFSAPESIALLTTASGSDVDPEVADRLLDRTEGWAAGLQLAGIALADPAARGRGPHELGSDQRHLFDYFASEVLPAFAPEQRDLLIRAAPLELLSGALCDAALQVSGSAAVLHDLERAGLFVVALDRDREWYRCHHLLRSALGWSSSLEPDEATRAVLRRAARWFLDRDRVDDAVRSLLSARDHRTAAELLEANRVWFLDRGWAATFLDLGARLPERAVSPGAALSLAYAATTFGTQHRIEHWLDVSVRNTEADSTVAGWNSLRAAQLSLRGLFATDRSAPDEAVALLEQSVALEAAAGRSDHPLAMLGLADAYAFAGRFPDAADILMRFWQRRDHLRLPTSVALQAAGQLLLSLEAMGSFGELDRILPIVVADADAAEARWGAAAAGSVTAMIRIVQGRRAYELGDQAAAMSRLATGLRFAEMSGLALSRVLALVYTADTRLAAGDAAGAREALVRAREVADTEPVVPFASTWLESAEHRIGRSAARTAQHAGRLFEDLSDRELSLLRMLPGDATQREIGAALYLSINTVKGYSKSLYRKLGVGGRQEAVQVGRRLGLI